MNATFKASLITPTISTILNTRVMNSFGRGLAFDELHRRGIDTVVARLEMQFKTPLRPGDEFLSQLSVRREGIKYVFEQQLLRLPDRQLCLKAQTTVVAIVNGRLGDCEELQQLVP